MSRDRIKKELAARLEEIKRHPAVRRARHALRRAGKLDTAADAAIDQALVGYLTDKERGAPNRLSAQLKELTAFLLRSSVEERPVCLTMPVQPNPPDFRYMHTISETFADEWIRPSYNSLRAKRQRRFANLILKAERGERLDRQDITLLKRVARQVIGVEGF